MYRIDKFMINSLHTYIHTEGVASILDRSKYMLLRISTTAFCIHFGIS